MITQLNLMIKMTCQICFNDCDEITFDNQLFNYCYECLTYLLEHQFDQYLTLLKSTDCKSTLTSLMKLGAPRYFRDPLINNHQPIKQFIYKNQIISGRVTNIDKDKIKAFNLKLLENLNCIESVNINLLIDEL